VQVTNPLRHHATQQPTVKIEQKLHEIAFGRTKREDLDDKRRSHYEEILQRNVIPLMQQFPRYKLYVTGYSDGAALATLFGFMFAAESDEDVVKPVSVVSIASPYVGDESFRSAHQLLESHGKLRHLRVSNHGDFATLGPVMSWRWRFYDKFSHVGLLFKHTGMNLRLYEWDSAFELSYPKVHSGYFSSLCDEFRRAWEQSCLAHIRWNPTDYFTNNSHDLQEYIRQLVAHKPSLQSLQLNDLYARPDLVGHLLHQI
jgi:hypothetical protein